MKKIVSLLLILCLSNFWIGCDKKYNSVSNDLKEKEVSIKNHIYILKENNAKIKSPIDKTYLKKYNKEAKEDLVGKSEDSIINIYRTPFYEITYLPNHENAELIYKIFIYLPDSNESDADNSALTIIFKNNLVINYKIDDFNGLNYSNIPNIFNNLIN